MDEQIQEEEAQPDVHPNLPVITDNNVVPLVPDNLSGPADQQSGADEVHEQVSEEVQEDEADELVHPNYVPIIPVDKDPILVPEEIVDPNVLIIPVENAPNVVPAIDSIEMRS